MYNSTREFEACVLVNGKPVTEVVHNGQTFIEGRRKSTYELSFRNNSNQTVLVVPSVDGLSVIDGQRAGKQSPGYVIGPWDSVNVPGWTVNGREAAEFIFHAQDAHYADEKTYAEEMDEDPANQGAIGFMVFRQLPQPRPSYMIPISGSSGIWKSGAGSPTFGGGSAGSPSYDSGASTGGYVRGSTTGAVPLVGNAETRCVSSSNVSGSVLGSVSNTMDSLGNTPDGVSVKTSSIFHVADVDEGKSLGTGFGEAVEFETQNVEFRREANPCAVFAFFYDTLKNLRKIGVPVGHFNRHYSESVSNAPNPFPDSPEVTGNYANAPRGWTGRRGSTTRRRKTRS